MVYITMQAVPDLFAIPFQKTNEGQTKTITSIWRAHCRYLFLWWPMLLNCCWLLYRLAQHCSHREEYQRNNFVHGFEGAILQNSSTGSLLIWWRTSVHFQKIPRLCSTVEVQASTLLGLSLWCSKFYLFFLEFPKNFTYYSFFFILVCTLLFP